MGLFKIIRGGHSKKLHCFVSADWLCKTKNNLGIGIGILLSEKGGSEEDVTSVVLQGMAAGTLLYVVFFEVLARERSNRHSGFWQLVAIILGFGIMFGLQFLSEYLMLFLKLIYCNKLVPLVNIAQTRRSGVT